MYDVMSSNTSSSNSRRGQQQEQRQQQRQRRRNRRRHRRPQPSANDACAIEFPPNLDEAGSDAIDRICRSFGLLSSSSSQFPDDVLEYCDAVAAAEEETTGGTVSNNDGSDADDSALEDYTEYPFVTIDGDRTVDLDQAVWISRHRFRLEEGEKDDDGGGGGVVGTEDGFRVSYAVADAAHFVPSDSPAFRHALEQGATFYLPGKSVPMLPDALRRRCMSLDPGVRRRALVFDVYVDGQGRTAKTGYTWALVRSRWKGTFREVAEYYEATDKNRREEHPLASEEYAQSLDLFRNVGKLLAQNAGDRHVVDYQSREASGKCYVALDESTDRLVFERGSADGTAASRYCSDVEQYNESISLLANSEGAALLDGLSFFNGPRGSVHVIHPIYKSQSAPTEAMLSVLEKIIYNTLESNGLDAERYAWRRTDGVPPSAYLQRLREERDAPQRRASTERDQWSAAILVIERQARMTNSGAKFSATPGDGHHGLKMSHYARFTSPLREIVGCFTHKELKQGSLGGLRQSRVLAVQTDSELREQVILSARRAKAVQKRLSGAVFLHVMNLTFYKDLQQGVQKRRLYKGTILGIDYSNARNKSRRCYVKLDDPGIEIKVYGEDLDYFYNCRYWPDGDSFGDRGTCVSIAPLEGSFNEDADDVTFPPAFRAGQRVTIRVSDYAHHYDDTTRSRWIFVMDELLIEDGGGGGGGYDDEEEKVQPLPTVGSTNPPPARSSLPRSRPSGGRSRLRNSIVERDVFVRFDSAFGRRRKYES